MRTAATPQERKTSRRHDIRRHPSSNPLSSNRTPNQVIPRQPPLIPNRRARHSITSADPPRKNSARRTGLEYARVRAAANAEKHCDQYTGLRRSSARPPQSGIRMPHRINDHVIQPKFRGASPQDSTISSSCAAFRGSPPARHLLSADSRLDCSPTDPPQCKYMTGHRIRLQVAATAHSMPVGTRRQA